MQPALYLHFLLCLLDCTNNLQYQTLNIIIKRAKHQLWWKHEHLKELALSLGGYVFLEPSRLTEPLISALRTGASPGSWWSTVSFAPQEAEWSCFCALGLNP